MTTTINLTISALVFELNDKSIYNDIRVYVPNYRLTVTVENPVPHWEDLIFTGQDTESQNKYGRRSEVQEYHVIDWDWAEGFCAAELLRYKDVYPVPQVTVPGLDETSIEQCLTFKISDQIAVIEPVSGLNGTFWIDGFTLAFDIGTRQPVMNLNLTGVREYELKHIFRLDYSVLDGDDVLG